MVRTEATNIRTPAGHDLAISCYHPDKACGRSLIIASATGVKQGFYNRFALYFAHLGYTVYTFDYYGIGKSGAVEKALKESSNDLYSWGHNDLGALVAYASDYRPGDELILVTHSLGGQIAGFNPFHHKLSRMVFVASQSGYWKYYKGYHRPKMWVFWNLLIPILTPIFGYFPARKLGLFENLPAAMALQWRRWGLHPDYMKGDPGLGENYFDLIRLPLLVLSFPKDPFAPADAVDWLGRAYSTAEVDRRHLIPAPGEPQPGHFGFFRQGIGEPYWEMVREWFDKA